MKIISQITIARNFNLWCSNTNLNKQNPTAVAVGFISLMINNLMLQLKGSDFLQAFHPEACVLPVC